MCAVCVCTTTYLFQHKFQIVLLHMYWLQHILFSTEEQKRNGPVHFYTHFFEYFQVVWSVATRKSHECSITFRCRDRTFICVFFQQLLRPSIHTSKSVTKTYRGDISQYLRVGHTILIQPQMPAFVKWCNEVIVHIFYNIYNNLRVMYWITLVSHIWGETKCDSQVKGGKCGNATMQCHPQSESGWLKFVVAPVIRTEMPQNQPTQPQQLSRQNSNNGSRCEH